MNDTSYLTTALNQKYRYGFELKIEKESFPKGININVLNFLSNQKEEANFLKKFRIKSLKIWKKFFLPDWTFFRIPKLNFQKIIYYSTPKKKQLKNIDSKIFETFEKLGIVLKESKKLDSKKKNVAIDAIFDSVSIGTTYKKQLAKIGIIFSSISESIKLHPKLIEKFLGSVVSPFDNYFACLNSAIFSDGSFCYIPKNTLCPLELSTYFRINDKKSGQFERTLIVAEENSYLSYLEGCTAPQYSKNQLHAAVVELISFTNAEIKYSTVQNWYRGNEKGVGGIYNFVTKRALCIGINSKVSWTQVETGSAITWKYPSCILIGNSSCGEFYSISLTENFQQADTGSKMIHLGKITKSKIISKGISSGVSKNVYRGLIKIGPNAKYSRNFSQCDSFLIGSASIASTCPYFHSSNSTSVIEHEAKISKINDEQLFYFLQRGISIEKSVDLILTGFCKEVLTTLPLEFTTEANKLLTLKLGKGIG